MLLAGCEQDTVKLLKSNRLQPCLSPWLCCRCPTCFKQASAMQIMVGAVSRVLKVERCERVQLVAAAVRLYIASCHDCVFYLGINRAPLLLGDNRFLQVGM